MNEDILRAMIRESVARRLGGPRPVDAHAERPLPFSAHSSHFRYTVPESDGPCHIEPGVQCAHCGFCQSHGY